jgi:uncharacterized membrane protein
MTTDPIPAPAPVPVPTPTLVPVTEDRTVAIVSYLTLFGFIAAIIIHSNKKTSLGGFHLRQVLGLFITGIAFWPAAIILAFIPFLGWLAIIVGWFGLLALVIIGFIGAITGKQNPVPLLGKYYQKWFAGAFN